MITRAARLLQLLAVIAFVATPVMAAQETKTIGQIHTVAIIAAMGQATYREVALSGIGTDDYPIDSGNWGLDQMVIGEITALLKDRYTVLPADYDHAAFADPGSGPFSHKASLYDLVVGRTDRALVDAYIIIVPTSLDASRYGVNPNMRGVGMYRQPGILAPGYTVGDYAIYDMMVIDAYTLDYIAKQTFTAGASSYGIFLPPQDATAQSSAPDTFANFTDGQRAAFRTRATALIHAGIRPTLALMGLIPGAPEPRGNALWPGIR